MKTVWSKAAAVVFAAAAAAVLPGSFKAQADVIWEPDDPFYMEKSWEEDRGDEFVHEDRNYFANQPQGYLYVVDNPEDQTIVDALENGTMAYVSFTYLDESGKEWGVIQYQREETGEVTPNYSANWAEGASVMTGWIRMEDVSLVYDSRAFMEEHQDEIRPASGKEKVSLGAGEEVQYWSYPGSGSIVTSSSYMDDKFHADYVYADPDGREWAHISYYYSIRDVWVCLTDPAAVDLPVHEGQTDELLPLKTPPKELPATMAEAFGDGAASSRLPVWLTVFGLAALSIGASAGIIRHFHLQKQEEEEPEKKE